MNVVSIRFMLIVVEATITVTRKNVKLHPLNICSDMRGVHNQLQFYFSFSGIGVFIVEKHQESRKKGYFHQFLSRKTINNKEQFMNDH